jgi:hypothetical protein
LPNVTITWPTLFRGIPPLLREQLPADLGAVQWNAINWQAKAWFGNKALHYEIWVRYNAKIVELGLHFEADALTNARLLGAFRMRSKDVKRGLGAAARIEEWDKGWTRVWEPFALEKLSAGLAEGIQARFVDYVRVLEPIVREELPNDVAWKLAPPRRAAKITSSRTSRSGK